MILVKYWPRGNGPAHVGVATPDMSFDDMVDYIKKNVDDHHYPKYDRIEILEFPDDIVNKHEFDLQKTVH